MSKSNFITQGARPKIQVYVIMPIFVKFELRLDVITYTGSSTRKGHEPSRLEDRLISITSHKLVLSESMGDSGEPVQ